MSLQSQSPTTAIVRALAATACALASASAWSQTTTDCLAAATPVASIDMRVLVLAADGNEAALPAIKNSLDYLGVPYDVVLAKDTVLAQGMLCTASGGSALGKYQGVMLATGSLVYYDATLGYTSALSTEEWTRLWQYEAKYRVRQASLYTQPGTTLPETYGLGVSSPQWGSDTGAAGLSTTLTTVGKTIFPYLVPTAPVVFKNTWAYKAAAVTATPLLVDAYNNAIVSVNNTTDGRQSLSVTADGNPYLMHTLQLNYGIVNWVTKGLYVGQRQVYMSAQPDDVFIADDIWDVARNSDQTGLTYRITANDYKKYREWQDNRNKNGVNIVTEMPFNAYGTTAQYAADGESYFPLTKDDLTPAIKGNNDRFAWISHTYSHANLDTYTYAQTLAELTNNDTIATSDTLKLQSYTPDALVTPDISGLNNPEALRAMYDFGVRYLVSNTSLYCGHRDQDRANTLGCPKPNLGIYNDLEPRGLLMIPRYPANLFYNVSTPAEWVSEYNFIYRAYWGRDLTYAEILDKESDVWLRYLLNFDMRPVMFHQPNLRAYDKSNSLLGDLIDKTIEKYSAISNLPPQSRSQRQIGNLMAQRMALNAALAPASGAALTARIVPGATSSSIVITNPTSNVQVVPITGVNWSAATSRETYGGQTTSKLTVNNGASVTVTGAPAW